MPGEDILQREKRGLPRPKLVRNDDCKLDVPAYVLQTQDRFGYMTPC
jgi:hypothetical protein